MMRSAPPVPAKELLVAQHDPYVLPMVDVADKWVVRCDCGCGAFEQYATQDEAQDRSDALRAENEPPASERAQAVDEVRAAEGSDPV
ncbi:hypothetical protein PP1_005645 [Pseudonocardia sp. P1]